MNKMKLALRETDPEVHLLLAGELHSGRVICSWLGWNLIHKIKNNDNDNDSDDGDDVDNTNSNKNGKDSFLVSDSHQNENLH